MQSRCTISNVMSMHMMPCQSFSFRKTGGVTTSSLLQVGVALALPLPRVDTRPNEHTVPPPCRSASPSHSALGPSHPLDRLALSPSTTWNHRAPPSSSPPLSLPIEAAPLMALMDADSHHSLSQRSLSLPPSIKTLRQPPWICSQAPSELSPPLIPLLTPNNATESGYSSSVAARAPNVATPTSSTRSTTTAPLLLASTPPTEHLPLFIDMLLRIREQREVEDDTNFVFYSWDYV